jgi:hypothetical protein
MIQLGFAYIYDRGLWGTALLSVNSTWLYMCMGLKIDSNWRPGHLIKKKMDND